MTDLVDGSAAVGGDRPTLLAMAQAAAAWEVAVRGAEQRHQWAQADRARLRWALCLHRLGRCDDAVEVLGRAWDGASIGRRGGRVVAAIMCIRLLRWCGRQDEAGVLWSVMQTSTTSAMRRWALNELLSPANSDLNKAGPRRHGEVCTYRRREASVPQLRSDRLGLG
ncbi:hypothetical protein AB0F81_29820 [Actinoplanes sp. NPDC024001]|uniref:hypothetical protein n=1 Tax=Actinoplanes sp. NPDC024001 TaxID=3154598 RepID=UPI003400130C